MTNITFKGNPISTIGALPAKGTTPKFTLTKNDLSEISSKDLRGQKVILNIYVSLDTPVCSLSVQKFNDKKNELENVNVVCVSADLPFAATRFCDAAQINNAIITSTFRHPEFGKNFGVTIAEGPLQGLLSRAIVVLDEKGKVLYSEQVAEVTNEPDYAAAIAAAT
ncbi:MAG TPA: thiol peroxidase [Gammaproteobacteria bacterium]|nr:thiol peroxidase [Gammaproteobacteria bacterium]